jgi:hypothetical protein
MKHTFSTKMAHKGIRRGVPKKNLWENAFSTGKRREKTDKLTGNRYDDG